MGYGQGNLTPHTTIRNQGEGNLMIRASADNKPFFSARLCSLREPAHLHHQTVNNSKDPRTGITVFLPTTCPVKAYQFPSPSPGLSPGRPWPQIAFQYSMEPISPQRLPADSFLPYQIVLLSRVDTTALATATAHHHCRCSLHPFIYVLTMFWVFLAANSYLVLEPHPAVPD